MLPSRTQVMMVVIGDVPQLTKPELCNNAGNFFGHREERSRQSGVLPGGVPGNDERIPHQIDSWPAHEEAGEAGLATLPSWVVLRALPPDSVAELDVCEQKRALTRTSACRTVETHPEIPVHPDQLGQVAIAVLACGLGQLLDEQFVELMNEIEEGASGPRGDRS